MNENEIKTEPLGETAPTETAPGVASPAPEIPVSAPENAESETASGREPEGAAAPAPDGSEKRRDDEIYRMQAERDLLELQKIDPDAGNYRHLGEMPGALRFAELRGLGLTVKEAYYAVRGAVDEKPVADRGGRAHLHGSVPGRAASGGNGMTVGEIENARRLFPGLPDREIASLWRRVNEN